jgi:regulator of sigma E protease
MGNSLWSRTVSGTKYALRLVPLGGYVRLAGLEPDDYDNPEGFHTKPAYQRLLVLFAGPAVNFAIASLIVTSIGLTQLNGEPGKLNAVIQGTPAALQGLQPDDRILSVNGQPLQRQEQILEQERAHPGDLLTLVVRQANGSERTVVLLPTEDNAAHVPQVGIQTRQVIGPGEAIMKGVTYPFQASVAIGLGIYDLLSGRIPGGILGPEGVTGPVGIVAITRHESQGGPLSWIGLVAGLSVALGLFNLLPLPALDGGRIMVVLLERLRGRPFNREREMRVQRAGLVALLTLVAIVTYFDVQRIVTGQFPLLK